MEKLTGDDWTLDPAIFNFQLGFHPTQYTKGVLAESWEFPDPSTYLVHLRKGIRWQDISPANGREFVASDVAFHYNRLYGLGGGFTQPSPFQASVVNFKDLQSVDVIDKYTVSFKWKTPNPEFIVETVQAVSTVSCIENPETVQKYGNLNDWHNAIGTGPYILTDFVSGSSATLTKNPNYWGYDERYPKNKLPYIDTISYLTIPDDATALAALRTAKLDFMDQISPDQVTSLKRTNPNLLLTAAPSAAPPTIDPRNDVKPFNDVKVRQAMQMAINLPDIAKNYYSGTASPAPSSLTSNFMSGWGWHYDQWPQELKDQYAFNPTAAKKLLSDAGYPNGFKTDIVADASGDMGLLQIVKSYFMDVGIDMEIRPMDAASWSAFVQTGHKHDALAQRGTGGQLGQTYEPLRQFNRIQTGYSTNWNMVADPVFDAFYTKALAATSIEGVQQVLRDANEYVARQHFSISLLQPSTFSLVQPWLKGYNGQNGSVSGAGGSPSSVGFYVSRFWIDNDLKKKLAH
jgi:peptide/nickel transport system substrate-binding protein